MTGKKKRNSKTTKLYIRKSKSALDAAIIGTPGDKF